MSCYSYTTKLFKMWDTLFKKSLKYKANALPLGHTSSTREICSRQGSNLRSFAKFVKTLSTGVEPVTSRLTVAHSNQLSYERRGRATKDRTRDNWSLATKRIVIIIQNYNPMLYQLSYRTVMPAGFEPALFRTRALIWRLRPLGHGIVYKLLLGFEPR